MTPTWDNESQRSPKRSSQPGGRRVSFAEATVATSTDETTRSTSQPFPFHHGGGLRSSSSTARRTSATGGFWSNQRPRCYGHDFASLDSSMTALLGGQPTARLRASEPAMPPSPYSLRRSSYWVRPPFGCSWLDASEQPCSETTLFQAAPPAADRGTSAFSWLRNIGIGVMVAAMLTMALTLALTIDTQNYDVTPWPTSPVPSGMEMIGSSRAASPLEPMIVLPEQKPAATVRPMSEARKVTRHHRRSAKVERRDRALGVQQPRLPQPDANNLTLMPHRCRSHFYTYCHHGRNEVYYSATLCACTSTEADSVHVCNHGANRFTSLDSCLVSCVHVGYGRPQRRCYEGALFATCSWQDAAETWWHFDGSVCAPWNFPLGKSPLQDGRVFRSRRECDAACVHRERDNSDEQRRCDAPDAGTCAPRQIRHPYFTDMSADGPARCVVASSGDLITRRCLVGPNRFDSMASCKRACVEL
ncbi:hypothetical protein HPB49_019861 [Dermacentor silvarum]|uniref:Uncharacterized protein n=1 Tax=Dermacentor silvarum TaxID=543639 RepID=A0ACB8CH07_DERSI|nr:hypothetical protein HPB49_019861 [Dermacentor silvarum]